jgi:hypothetical protein
MLRSQMRGAQFILLQNCGGEISHGGGDGASSAAFRWIDAIVVSGYNISLRWCDLDYLTFLEYASNCKFNAAIARVSRYAILTKTFWLEAGVSCCRIERSAPFARSAASHYRVLQSFRHLWRQ